jgi:hypothetical protein
MVLDKTLPRHLPSKIVTSIKETVKEDRTLLFTHYKMSKRIDEIAEREC